MKKILVLITVVIVALAAFWYLGSGNQNTGSLSASVAAPQSADAKYIYSLLQSMSQVRLDDSIFSNSIFTSLKDNTVTLSAQASGRNNPFAPVGVEGSPSVLPPANTTKTK